MQYVGVDIVEIDRIQRVIDRWGQVFLSRVYTPIELKLFQNTSSLAARFAAKEAVLKALNACDKGIGWQEIEILAEANGKPFIQLSGKAKLHASECALNRLNISLSHSREYAVAFVVGETG